MKKSFLYTLFCIVSILLISCGDEKKETSTNTDYTSLLKTFPVETLVDLAEEISPEDWQIVLDVRFSNTWLIEKKDSLSTISIVNKLARDNRVDFVFQEKAKGISVLVKQYNAQNQSSAYWSFQSNSSPDWRALELPEIPLSEYLAENVNLPEEYAGYKPYLGVENSNDTIYYRINKQLLAQGIAKYYYSYPEMVEASYVKYYHRIVFDGESFVTERVLDKDYQELLTVVAEIDEEYEDGPEVTYWACPYGYSVITSSTLNNPDTTYAPDNMLDYENSTAWSEGNAGDGVGEWIEFTNRQGYYYLGRTFQIQNGYVKSEQVWKANNRVKKMAVYFNNKLIANVHLMDVDRHQSFTILPSWTHGIEPKKGDKIKFVIEEIYKGDKYDDTLISYFIPTGECGG